MNKKIIIPILMCLLLFNVVSALSPGNLKISLLSQEPDPVGPGEYVDFRFKIENIGESNLNDVSVKLNPKYPFYVENNEEKFIGDVWAGLNNDNGLIIKYKVKVDDKAVDGTNTIGFMYKSGESALWSEVEFDVNVRAIYDQIFIQDIVITPEEIHAGEVADVTFKVSNLGETIMKDITISLDLTGTTTPFVPSGEISHKRLKTLQPGEDGEINFRIKADPNGASQLYKIPLTLEYYDLLNNEFTKTDVLGLELGGKPTILVSLDESDVYMSGTTGEIIISIINNGETDVKFLNVVFEPREDYVIIEGAKQYIGNLDSDDFDTAKVKVHLDVNCSEFNMPVILEYKDALGNEYLEKREVNIPFYSKEEALKFGLTQKSNSTGTFIILVIVVGGYMTYRFFKKRRAKKQA
jgi:hypothetical protein